jgi:hypothetical protein
VRDSDRRPAPSQKGAPRPPVTDEWLDANQPKEPDWLKPYDRACVDVFELHPTLEPALWRTNSALIELFLPEEPEVPIAESAEEDFGDETLGAPVNLSVAKGPSGKWTVDSVDRYFRSGGGKGKKAITSLQVADAIDSNPSVPLSLPEALSAAFEHLWEGFLARTQPGPMGGNIAEVPEGVPTDA